MTIFNSTFLRAPGLWAESRQVVETGLPTLFLDRDGVVVEERHYLRSAKDVSLTAGAGDAIATLNRLGLPIVLITNQAGIGRGIFDWPDFISVQDEMHRQLRLSGAHIDAVYACAYHKDGREAYAIGDHPWRKPNAGMIEAAGADLGALLSASWIIGDRATDLEAGKQAGLCGGTLVSTGYGSDSAEIEESASLQSKGFVTSRAPSLAAAIHGVVLPGLGTLRSLVKG